MYAILFRFWREPDQFMSVSYIARRASQEALRQMSFVFNTIFLVPVRTESVPRLFFLTGIR
jgi:hypothetical protein